METDMSRVKELAESNEGWILPTWIKVRLLTDYSDPVTKASYKAGSEFIGRDHYKLSIEKKTFALLRNALSVDTLPIITSVYGPGFGWPEAEIVEIWQAELKAKQLWSKE